MTSHALVLSQCADLFGLSEGFIGGGFDFSPSSPQIPALSAQLSSARAQLSLENSESTLPIGIGLITFGPGDPITALLPLLLAHRPAAVWLFAPAARDRHTALIPAFKSAGASWNLKVFVQVGTVQAAREAVEDGCDVVVAQGGDAGGHQWAQGASLISLIPEVVDMLREEFGGKKVSVLAAGGIADGRGIAAGLVLGRNISEDLNSHRGLTFLKGQRAQLWAQGYSSYTYSPQTTLFLDDLEVLSNHRMCRYRICQKCHTVRHGRWCYYNQVSSIFTQLPFPGLILSWN